MSLSCDHEAWNVKLHLIPILEAFVLIVTFYYSQVHTNQPNHRYVIIASNGVAVFTYNYLKGKRVAQL